VCDQGITARLFGAGFQPRLPSFFILEGLLMYLTPVQTEATMRWIAGVVSPGSAVVFDYLTHAPIAPTVALNRDRLLASWGEPVRFRPPEGELPKQLESWGLECVVHESLDARPLPDRSWCVVAKT
jgi:O-methyltransferase involved in polyketide biosynthesis